MRALVLDGTTLYVGGAFAQLGDQPRNRLGLAQWLTRPDHPLTARVVVNRLWAHFLGRGLVHEADDMRETNPPSNPELLDALRAELPGPSLESEAGASSEERLAERRRGGGRPVLELDLIFWFLDFSHL